MITAAGDHAIRNAFARSENREGQEKKPPSVAPVMAPMATRAVPRISRLAGQPNDYLEKSVRDYKSDKSARTADGPQAQNLSKQDMKDLAAYFSGLSGDLRVKY